MFFVFILKIEYNFIQKNKITKGGNKNGYKSNDKRRKIR